MTKVAGGSQQAGKERMCREHVYVPDKNTISTANPPRPVTSQSSDSFSDYCPEFRVLKCDANRIYLVPVKGRHLESILVTGVKWRLLSLNHALGNFAVTSLFQSIIDSINNQQSPIP